jgi:glycosyltransferase involved in cell wall biosynthesis
MFPAFESLHCRGNRRLWQRVLDQYDVHQVVCGYALTALPHALCGKPFVAWVASSMDGDKRERMAQSGFIRRMLHRAQAKELARLERFVLERAAWVLALSAHTHSELLQRGADPTRISLLPCPVDVDRLTPAANPPDRPRVICVGRHSDPRKNIALLMRAFARVVKTVPDAQLVLVGDADPARLRCLADEFKICDHMQFTGEIPDDALVRFYREASVLAIPSEQEGLGIVGLEAMACGLPVVSTRCGGPESFVLHDKTGLLVEPNNEAQMADALHYLLTDRCARERMGAQARLLVEQRFSFRSFSRQLTQVYATVRPDVFVPTHKPVQPLAEPAQFQEIP